VDEKYERRRKALTLFSTRRREGKGERKKKKVDGWGLVIKKTRDKKGGGKVQREGRDK